MARCEHLGRNSPDNAICEDCAWSDEMERRADAKREEKAIAKYYKKSLEVCCICGYDIGKAGEQPSTKRGRQWGGSIQIGEKWVCGSCSDEIGERYIDSTRRG